MAGWLNLCQFIGNAGKDPEVRTQADGGVVARLSIAVNETWKDKSGEKQERVTWVPVVCFGKLANVVVEYIKKGDQVYVQGRFSVRPYEKDGVTKRTTEVIGDRVLFLGKRDHADIKSRTDSEEKAKPASPGAKKGWDDFESDVPF